ncbi:TetR/AcrR family transcriptional regulator [Nocardiopsis sp. CC223A]|uniref:TetR/AcrR family transcriptional regulator n=1 Tax=Nocardiopsis sp. CC223A TaxID=3044051 RepID=UPI00278C4C56|nr:TetR/AcrR family transcriptional regulator [Nocardiopsis sp. CC223A]
MADDNGSELERRLALLWGERAAGRRGPRPRLTVTGIADAAIRVADAEGLEALSMQRVATELGCATMSLYNHVPNKDVLLELMVDAAAGTPPDLDGAGDWREAVLAWADALWRAFRARPWILRVTLEHAPLGPHQLAWLDLVVRRLLDGGLTGDEAMAAALHLIAAIRGMAQVAADLTGAGARESAEARRILARIVDPERFPGLAAAAAAPGFGDARAVADGRGLPADARFAVERLLDGITSWSAARTT